MPAPQLHRHLCAEAIADGGFEPYRLLASFDEQDRVALLENPGVATSFGRYAYVCADAFWVFRSKRRRAWSGPPGAERELEGDPLAALAELLRRFRCDVDRGRPDLPPFCGGAVGYLGYELLYLIESIPDRGRDDLALPDLDLFFSGLVYAQDRLSGRSWVLASGFGEDPSAAAAEARERLALGRERLARLAPARRSSPPPPRPRLREQDLERRGITPCVDRRGYLDAIADVKHNIIAGNVFEVCLTQRFDLRFSGSGRALYDALRTVNPAPMTAYLRLAELELLSSSPERFLSLDRAGVVETRPIKGTRPRGATPERDAALRSELEQSEKDRAENLMIVDLARNDLGKVCRFGSVEVTQLCAIEPYEYTWQMVSTIRGVLDDRHDIVGLLRAAFPGLAGSGGDPQAFLDKLWAGDRINGQMFNTLMMVAMAATYAPEDNAPLGIRLPVDLDTCARDSRRWARWLAHDPLELAGAPECVESMKQLRGLYLDCGWRDEHFIHFGSRALVRKLVDAEVNHVYQEFDGGHSNVSYRLDVSLPFLYRALTGD